MVSEAELRLRYQTIRFREAPSSVEVMENELSVAELCEVPTNESATENAKPFADSTSAKTGIAGDIQVSDVGHSGTVNNGAVEEGSSSEQVKEASMLLIDKAAKMEGSQTESNSGASPLLPRAVSSPSTTKIDDPTIFVDERLLERDGDIADAEPMRTEATSRLVGPHNIFSDRESSPLDTSTTPIPATLDSSSDTDHEPEVESGDEVLLDNAESIPRHDILDEMQLQAAVASVAPHHLAASGHPYPPRRSSSLTEDSRDISNSLPESTPTSNGGRPANDDIVLPRWQPDAEVTYCPICSTQFSFFIRKHHCRKCGRVVCARCSPHRITIPYQFIVQPPADGPTSTRPSLSQRDTDNFSTFGGTKVRLCNPCVPDPNILPPQPQRTSADDRGRRTPPTYYLNAGNRPYSFGEEGMSVLERQANAARGRAATSSSATQRQQMGPQDVFPVRTSSQNYNTSYTGPHFARSNQPSQRPHRLPPSSYNHNYSPRPGPRHQSHQSLSISSSGSAINPQPHYRSLLDPSLRTSSGPEPSSQIDTSRPLPPIPRIREEDECPVCHCELPSRTLPDYETVRANHVTQCIEDQISMNSGRARQPAAFNMPTQDRPLAVNTASTASVPLSQHPPSPVPSPALVTTPNDIITLRQAINLPTTSAPPLLPTSFPNTPEGRTAFREAQHAAVVLGRTRSPSGSPGAGSSIPPEPRRTGMFPYRATEKDCVDDAECTICLEEFEVGDAMARLECLCRFHERCIRSWWEGRPGRCPVHGHDGWGF